MVDPWGEQGEIVSTEPVNELYVQQASIGPYAPGMVSPAGSAPIAFSTIEGPGGTVSARFAITDAPATCGDGLDGSLELPMDLPASGWWEGVLCGYGHASYIGALVRGGRSLTVEVTALDEDGAATTRKAMPVIGLYGPSDVLGELPSLGAAAGAFNSQAIGTTTLGASPFPSGSPATQVRIGIADQRSDGRPDFSYQARFFYADTIYPEVLGLGGGTISIIGSGFRAGNRVTVGGTAALVTGWTATTISAIAPSMNAVGATSGTPVDVVITDMGTGASSSMSGALTYQPDAAAAPRLRLVSAPALPVFVGDTAPVPIAVQAFGSDGLTPLAGASIVLTATPAGSVRFAACKATACTITTDANGLVTSAVTPEITGTIMMQATSGALDVETAFEALSKPAGMRIITAPAPAELVGVPAKDGFMVQIVTKEGMGISGEPITFSVTRRVSHLQRMQRQHVHHPQQFLRAGGA